MPAAVLSKPCCKSSSSKTKSLVTQTQSVLVCVPSTSKMGLDNILIDISDSESEIDELVQSCTSQQEKASDGTFFKEKPSEVIISKEMASEKNSEISVADDLEILFDKKGEALKEPSKFNSINCCSSSASLPDSSRVVINDKNNECSNDVLQKICCKELIQSTKLDKSSISTYSRPVNTIEEITINSDSDGETHISLNESTNGPSETKITALENSATNNNDIQCRTIIFTMASNASKNINENLKTTPEHCEKIPDIFKKSEGKWSLFVYL